MAAPTIDNWEDLLVVNLRTAMRLCDQYGVDKTGIKGIDEARQALIRKWEEKNGSIKLTESQKMDGIKTALSKTRHTSQELVNKYKDCAKLYRKLHPRIQKGLLSVFPLVDKVFDERIRELRKGECTIIIAGEVGAGKSSLINLLLGEDLLPTNALKCSNTICEMRTCPEGQEEMVLYWRETLGENGRWTTPRPEKRPLKTDKHKEELKEHITRADSEYEENPLEKIEIYFPFPMLPEGVVFVDTPGIEGGNDVVKRLEKYLTKTFGFIYVVNTNTAGGVQQGRLQRLLNLVVNASEDFTPEASLFVCNKWEQVPDSDKKAVEIDILSKLQRVYPGVKENQIHYMSVKQSNDVVQRYNARIAQHRKLLTKIEHFIPNCLCQGLNAQYTWLSNFLKKTVYFLKVSSASEAKSGEQIQMEYKSLKQQMDKLKKDADVTIKELRKKVDYELHRLKQEIKELLRSRKALDRVCRWEPSECPGSTKWKRLIEDASCEIAERISRFINSWEKETGVLNKIDKDIIRVFAEEFGLVENQVRELEDILLRHRGLGQMCHTVKVVPVKSLWPSKAKKKNIQKTYNTLGGAVSNVGTLSASDKETKKLFKKDYDKKKIEIMGEATFLFIKSIVEHRDFDSKLEKFFQRFTSEIDTAAKRIPSFIEADEQMIENLNAKMGDSDRVKEEFPVLITESNDMLADLDIFYVNRIMAWDYSIGDRRDITYDSSESNVLGSGAFAKVYKGILRSKKRDVALKVFNMSISRQTVTDILTEDRIMRDLNHANLVRYYGASYVPGKSGYRWVMVMEICSTSLRSIYINPDGEPRAPGKFSEDQPQRDRAMKTMANHALQIATGLSYIHKKGYAHRDLKLDNILIAPDGTIKLTDVGVAKPVNMIAMTCAGSPAYMAPEVLLANRNHDSKADIFSLAYVEYEMWYGCDLSTVVTEAVVNNTSANDHRDAITLLKAEQEKGEGSFRPSFAKVHRPPAPWIQLMQYSWHHDPDKRPNAAFHMQFFQQELGK